MARTDKRSRAASLYRKLYNTKAWRTLRWRILVRDGFTCQTCGYMEADTSKLVANHIVPHKGNTDLFYDESNIETACAPCHSSHIQSLESGGKGKPSYDEDGWPIDLQGGG